MSEMKQSNRFDPYRDQTGKGPALAETPLKKKIKGLVALGLCLCLGLGLLPTPAQAVAPTTKWTDAGNFDASWYNGTDTEFTLTTAKELAGLASLVDGGNDFSGKTVKLGADVDLSAHLWTPIGELRFWGGTFDGGRKTISGLVVSETGSYEVGLFGTVGGSRVAAVIRDLRIRNASVTGVHDTYQIAGILAGKLENGTIYNCAVSGSVSGTISGGSASTGVGAYVGGLVGKADSGATIKNCSAQITSLTAVTSPVDMEVRAGGIVGNSGNRANQDHLANCFANVDAVAVTEGGTDIRKYSLGFGAHNSYWSGATQLTDSGDSGYTECYAVTAEQIAGTATAIIGAGSTHANTPSLLTALNNWVAANTGYSSWNLKEGVPLPSIFAPVYIDLGVVPEQDKDSATGTLDADVQLHGQVQENVQLISVTLPATIPFILDVDNAGALNRVLSGTGTLTNRSDMGVTVTLTSVTDPDSLLTKADLSLVPAPLPTGGNVALSVGTGKTDVLSTLAAQTGGVPATSTLKVDGAAKASVPSVGGDGDTFTVGLTLKVSKT